MCPTWNGTSFPAVTPATPPLGSFLSATPGPVISVSPECIIPRALVIPPAIWNGMGRCTKLEWEDALCPACRLALRCCCLHLRGQGEEQHCGEVSEVEETSDVEEIHVRSGQKLDAH